MEEIYYIVQNGVSMGPYSKDGLRALNIPKSTFVWRHGLQDWVLAENLPELADVFEPDSAFGDYAKAEPSVYFAIINDVQTGPDSIDSLISKGLKADTPVWRNGMADWESASTQPEIMQRLSGMNRMHQTAIPPQIPRVPSGNMAQGYGQQNYRQPFGRVPRTDWKVWAIVAIIFGVCNCLGLIFGIIGYTKASQASQYYAMGNDIMGDHENNSAQIWTIVALVVDVMCIIPSMLTFIGIFE
ncbi:MAG: DUF4339 domain-containing protein [Prevotella sp.]|nr:DUF4339 domain-containing protein [Bacteroides sp.]MCM1366468.1 DUF4339 domain-containing protein [Prevotella sp.]MCM1437052.1 DUF4339 domain-containing protein [Prevotella sp.]